MYDTTNKTSFVMRNFEIVLMRLSQFIRRSFSEVEKYGIELAINNTKIILLTKKPINTECDFMVANAKANVTFKSTVNYRNNYYLYLLLLLAKKYCRRLRCNNRDSASCFDYPQYPWSCRNISLCALWSR